MHVLQVVRMTTRKILVINSEPALRELIQDCLYHLGGWQVSATGSSTEGLQQAAHLHPDAIVFDLANQGMNFYTFLKRLRAQPTTQTIPVVLVTAGTKWMDLESFRPFHVVGVIDYSTEPILISRQIAKILNWEENA